MKKKVESLRQKLALLYSELDKLENETNIKDYRYYGKFNPIIDTCDYLNKCLCGTIPTLKKHRKGYYLECDNCGYKSKTCRHAYMTILQFNKSDKSIHPHYSELPLFNLRDKSIAQAKEILKLIRYDLEIRKNIAGLRRQLGYSKTNIKHINKLKAFLAWTIYAQTLVKEAELKRKHKE